MGTSGLNNFEGGTDGTTITAAASGGASGTAFDFMFGTPGMIWKASGAIHGTMSGYVAAGGAGAGQWSLSSTKVSGKVAFTVDGVTTGDLYLARADNTSSTRLFSVHINAAGKLRVDDAAGTTGVFTFTNVLTANQKYWLQYYIVAGTATNNGTIKVAYYLDGSTTPVETAYVSTAANVGAGQTLGRIYFGQSGASGTVNLRIDDAQYDTTLTDLIGFPAATPPTVSTPANQNVTAGASVTESVTASGNGGATITNYAWSVIYSSTTTPTLTGASTSSVSFTATSDTTRGHLYILQCVVTDSNSSTTTVTTEVRVPTSGDANILPGSAAANVGSWSNVGGAATPGDAVSDTSDSTYVESPVLSASAVTERFRVEPMTARSSLTVNNARAQQDVTGALTAKLRLFQGTTQLQESAITPAVSPSWSSGTVTWPTTGITDFGNLYIEIYGTAP